MNSEPSNVPTAADTEEPPISALETVKKLLQSAGNGAEQPPVFEHDRLLRLAEKQLYELYAVIEGMPAGVYIGTRAGITTCNSIGLKMLGFSSLEELQQNVDKLAERIETRYADTGKRIPVEEEPFVRALNGQTCIREVIYRNVGTGQDTVVRCAAAPIFQDGKVVAAVAVNTDIDAQKKTEEALKHSQERFRAALLAVGDIIWTNSAKGEMIGEQMGWGEYTGQSLAEYQGYGWASAVHPEDAQPTIDAWNEAVTARRMFIFSHRVRRHDGVWRLFSIRAVPVLTETGDVREWVGVHTDITEAKEAEDRIQTLNSRLQRAMVETHHRVKNNLQIISALIDMQQATDRDVVPISELSRLGANVRALSVIHDILTQEAKNGSEQETLSTQAVLEKLLGAIAQAIGARSLKVSCTDVRIVGRQATSLVLVTNELVSNALKHGSGETEVRFSVKNGRASLEVCDDGPGFPPGFDATQAANTGLELVENIARWDLRGQTSYENRSEGGARIVVAFDLADA